MKSREIALCGMMNALAVVLLSLGGMVPIATYCAPLLAMAVLLLSPGFCSSTLAMENAILRLW
jgi:hypothetical protein